MSKTNPLKRLRHRLLRLPVQTIYALGLGGIIGHTVLLLTTTGRKSGQPRVMPLQYERVDDTIVIGSMHGMQADWVKNAVANPEVKLQIGRETVYGTAEATDDIEKVTDFIMLRYVRRPRMIGAILRADGVEMPVTRDSIETYARKLAMLVIHPHEAAPAP